MCENAILSHPLIKDAFEASDKRYAQIEKDMDSLSQAVKDSWEAEQSDFSFEDLITALPQKLNSWKQDIGLFQARLQSFNSQASFQLRNQKNAEHLENALQLTQEKFSVCGTSYTRESFLEGVLEGLLPPAFSYQKSSPLIMEGDQTSSLSSGRSSALLFYRLALYSILNTIDSFKDTLDAIYSADWLDTESVLIQPLCCPQGYNLDFNEFVLTVPYEKKSFFLAIGHYQFGGSRGESHLFHKPWYLRSQDCSSLVQYITGCRAGFSTIHQALAANSDFARQGKLDEIWKITSKISLKPSAIHTLWTRTSHQQWKSDPLRNDIEDTFASYRAPDKPTDIKAGMVQIERVYAPFSTVETLLRKNSQEIENALKNKSLPIYLNGKSGHTGLVLGTLGRGPDAKVLTLSATRSIQDITASIKTGEVDGVFMGMMRPLISHDREDGCRQQIYYAAVTEHK